MSTETRTGIALSETPTFHRMAHDAGVLQDLLALPLGQVPPPPPPLPERVARFSRCEEPELTIWLRTEVGWVEEERLSLDEAQALADVTPDLDLRLDILARLDGAEVECAEVDWCHNFAVTDVCWEHGGRDDV